jgi:hypothetical protein
MKKTLIATAVAASVVAPISAHAVNATANGTGEVLLYPYYNVNEGNATFFGVANTTADTKVVKVRFREGVESEDVLDFQVWLSPYDHWTAVLSQVGGNVNISTADTTCTVPSLASGTNFITNRISPLYTGDLLDRLSEGHIEIIEMATIREIVPDEDVDLAYAVKHVAGVPRNCVTPALFNSGIVDVRVPGPFTSNGVSGVFDQPLGGLYGIAAVFNPTDGTYFTYSAEALQNFAAAPIFYGQRGVPYTGSVTQPGIVDVTSDEVVLVEHGVLLFDLPDLSTPDATQTDSGDQVFAHVYRGGAACGGANPAACMQRGGFTVPAGGGLAAPDTKRDAVTVALLASEMANDFLTGAQYDTDWVFTFPGRYMYRDVPIATGGYPMDPDGPFESFVNRATGQGCEVVNIVGNQTGFTGVVDREEAQLAAALDIGFSPGTPADPFVLCYEVNVVSINDDGDGSYSAALTSSAVWNSANNNWPTFGFAEVGFPQFMVSDDATHIGLPFIGFAGITDRATEITRGGTFMHKITRGSTL